MTDPPYGIDIGASGYVGGSKPIGSYGRQRGDVVNATPYGESDWDAAGMTAEQWAAIEPKAKQWIVWGGNHLAHVLGKSQGVLIWDKKCKEWDDTFSDAEIAWTNAITRAKVFRHMWVGAFRDSEKGAGSRVHPTQKPVALMAWCLSFVPTGAVLDPFMGSGSTGVACAQLGRPFYGIEKRDDYFDIACRRIEDAQRQERLFA